MTTYIKFTTTNSGVTIDDSILVDEIKKQTDSTQLCSDAITNLSKKIEDLTIKSESISSKQNDNTFQVELNRVNEKCIEMDGKINSLTESVNHYKQIIDDYANKTKELDNVMKLMNVLSERMGSAETNIKNLKEQQKPQQEQQKLQDKPQQKPQERPQQKPQEKPQQKPQEKPQQKPQEKPQQKPQQKPQEKPQVVVPEVDCNIEDTTLVNCPICNELLPMSNLDSHLDHVHFTPQFICPFCGGDQKNQSQLNSHIMKNHPKALK
ncbi:hypothetical protein QTN25_002028 [Entamoeba marina]